MSAKIDLTGKRFGSWTVLGYFGCNDLGQPSWNCECACGTTRVVVGQTLRIGTSVSCGCTKGNAIRKAKLKHGQAGDSRGKGKTREYSAWEAMKRRCVTHQMPTWLYYGRMGVIVCDRWKDSFENFFSDMGKCPKGLTLDRIDPYGNYEPGNCRWASYTVQSNNRRKRNRAR